MSSLELLVLFCFYGTAFFTAPKDWRYIIVDAGTGEVLDDAQGYGYKTKQNAYKSWGYKHSGKHKHKSKHEYTDEEIDNELFQMKVLSQGGIK